MLGLFPDVSQTKFDALAGVDIGRSILNTEAESGTGYCTCIAPPEQNLTGSCADPCDHAETLNEPYMQVDVMDLARIFLVRSARYSTGLEKLGSIISTLTRLLSMQLKAS
jgi:hypothetical protein